MSNINYSNSGLIKNGWTRHEMFALEGLLDSDFDVKLKRRFPDSKRRDHV